MPILSDPVLEQLAVQHTDGVLKRFVVGATSYDLRPSTLGWNGHLRRHVFRQPMIVWRDATEVEITLSHDKRHVIRFRDPKRLSGAAPRKLDNGALLAIAATTGLVGKLATVSDVHPGPLYEFVVRQVAPGLPLAIRFTVNAAKKQVAAFEVTEDGR